MYYILGDKYKVFCCRKTAKSVRPNNMELYNISDLTTIFSIYGGGGGRGNPILVHVIDGNGIMRKNYQSLFCDYLTGDWQML